MNAVPAATSRGTKQMQFIEPHIHMASLTTEDYRRLAQSGCVLVSEPAFWPGYDRLSHETFRDYFRHLSEFEPTRAAKYGVKHYCWIGINAKEAEHLELSLKAFQFVAEFLDRPTVLGIGEVGLNKNTANECRVFEEHVKLAVSRGELMLVHTPHLAEKYAGTRMILDMLEANGAEPGRVLVDHLEEHTIELALEGGYWCGLTLYPATKCTPERAADIVDRYGPERILVNSAADWGPSDPLAVTEFVLELRARGYDEPTVQRIVYDNPLAFFTQCPRFQWPSR